MGNVEMKRLRQITTGSVSELEYQFVPGPGAEVVGGRANMNFLSDEVVEVKRVLASLIQRLRSDASNERAGD